MVVATYRRRKSAEAGVIAEMAVARLAEREGPCPAGPLKVRTSSLLVMALDSSTASGASQPDVTASPAPTSRSLGSTATSIAADAAVVVAFVLMGRNNHDEGLTPASVLGVAAPLLIALCAAWVVMLLATRRTVATTGRTLSVQRLWPAGIALWVTTAVGGLVLRNLVFGDGTAASFVVVTCVVLGVGMLGWRAVWTAATRAR